MLISTLCFGAAVLACCSFADRLGALLGVIDHPDGRRKTHARPTPLVGGIALMVPLVAIAFSEALQQPVAARMFTVIGLAGLGFLILGWFDDRHHATPRARLLIASLIGTVLLVAHPQLRLEVLAFGPLALPLGLLALPFTVLCLVGLQNAINMADGLNGLVIGLAIFWSLCLLLYAPPHVLPFLSFLLLGLFILLPYNLMGYLFLGDAGSYSLGVIVGLLMIHVYETAAGQLPMSTVMLWLLVPVLDCLRVMLVRILADRSPLSGDRNHLHHRLSRHWPWPVSVLVYLSIAAGPGLIAALWPEATLAMLVLAGLAYAGSLWLTRGTMVTLERRNLSAS